MSEWLDVKVDTIRDDDMMHLKSHLTYLGRSTFIATERYASHPALKGMEVIVVPRGEEYAADTLALDDTVLMAAGLVESHRLVRDAGFAPCDVGVLGASTIMQPGGLLWTRELTLPEMESLIASR